MLHATLRSLLARKLRLLLASFAVLLGVSFVAGAFVLTDTLGGVFDKLFASVSSNTSVTVQSASSLGDSQRREPVPQSVLDAVRQVNGVREAVGDVGGIGGLVLPNGKVLTKNGPPTLGVSLHLGSSMEALRVKSGKAPVGLDEVALDAGTAKQEHLKVGDHVGVLGKGPKREVTIVGLVGFKTTDSIAGATLLAFDPPSAQTLFGIPGTWSDLSVAADPGVSQTELRDRIAPVLPTGIEALTEAQSVDQNSKDLKQGLSFFNIALQAFAGISLFVGMFLIFNTFAMLVAQRTRELALMRALGASRGQVTRSVLLEALLVGLVSSVGGFGVGVGIAAALRGILNAIGIELPSGDLVIRPRTLVVSLVVGVGVTVVAALVPARRAAKVSPVQAMRESGPAEDRSLVRRSIVGGLVLAAGLAALVGGLAGGTVSLVGLGAAASFLGVTVLSPLFARPVVSLLAAPFAHLGVPGVLGRGNAMRSPRRTSATAAALMIGLALVAAISTLGASAKKSVLQIVSSSLSADYLVHTKHFEGFSPEVATALQKRPDLTAVAAFRQGQARIGKAGKVGVQGVEPTSLQQVMKLKVLAGDLASLTSDLAVSKTEATNLGVKVGDTVPVEWAKTGKTTMTIGAVYDQNQLAGGYLVSDKTYDANVTDPQLLVVAVKVAPSVTQVAARAAITQALSAFPNVFVQNRAEFVKTQGKQVDTLLNVITGLLVLSVLIAVLGIINTLALSVVERTRELGLLRAVGLQRRQLRLMIGTESVVIALFGALLGIVVGVGFGYALVTTLRDQGITEFAFPTARILVVLAVAAIGGVLAALLPARRAAKMNVLEAIAAA